MIKKQSMHIIVIKTLKIFGDAFRFCFPLLDPQLKYYYYCYWVWYHLVLPLDPAAALGFFASFPFDSAAIKGVNEKQMHFLILINGGGGIILRLLIWYWCQLIWLFCLMSSSGDKEKPCDIKKFFLSWYILVEFFSLIFTSFWVDQ